MSAPLLALSDLLGGQPTTRRVLNLGSYWFSDKIVPRMYSAEEDVHVGRGVSPERE